MTKLLDLPEELLWLVMVKADPRATYNLGYTCLRLFKISRKSSVWRAKFMRLGCLAPALMSPDRCYCELRSIEMVETSCSPIKEVAKLDAPIYSLFMLEGSQDILRYFHSDVLYGDIEHKDIHHFIPTCLSKNDELCIGREENDEWVIRRVDDWKCIQKFGKSDWYDRSFQLAFVGDYVTCVHYHGLMPGSIELYDQAGRLHKTLMHPGVTNSVAINGANRLITTNCETGDVRIWQLGGEASFDGPKWNIPGCELAAMVAHGNVIEFKTMDYTNFCRSINGEAVSWWREEWSENELYWTHFSDFTQVIGSVARDDSHEECCFTIITTRSSQNTFVERYVRAVRTFLDCFVVTITRCGPLKIWSKTGECLFQVQLGYLNPKLYLGRGGDLYAFSVIGGTYEECTLISFGETAQEELDNIMKHSTHV